jgi:uncharacterized protein
MSLGIWLLVILAGAIGQFVDTAVGMGFGVLASSFMIAAGVSPAVVVATVNLAKVGNGLMGAASHAKMGNVHWRWVIPLALPGVVGGVLGAILLVRIFDEMAKVAVPILLLGMGLALLLRFGRKVDAPEEEPEIEEDARPQSWVPIAVIGFAGGAINAMTGGYGPFTTSSLLLLRGGHPRHAIGTVNMVEFLVAGAAAVTLLLHLDASVFAWQLPVALLIGGLLTSLPGAYVSTRLSARVLGVGVGCSLLLLNAYAIGRSFL